MTFLAGLTLWPRTRPRCPRSPRTLLQLEALETRLVPYNTSGNAWPTPQLITLKFQPDGTNLGGVSSNLFATFNETHHALPGEEWWVEWNETHPTS